MTALQLYSAVKSEHKRLGCVFKNRKLKRRHFKGLAVLDYTSFSYKLDGHSNLQNVFLSDFKQHLISSIYFKCKYFFVHLKRKGTTVVHLCLFCLLKTTWLPPPARHIRQADRTASQSLLGQTSRLQNRLFKLDLNS